MNCIILDFDGTIVDDNRGFNEVMARYFSSWKNNGHYIAIATGRNFRSVEKELEGYNLDIDVIANNGNIIRNLKTKKTLYHREMDENFVRQILSILQELSIDPMFHVDGYERGFDISILTEPDKEMTYYLERYENRFKILSYHDILEENILSIVFYGDRELYKTLRERIVRVQPQAEIHILTKGMSYLPIIEIIGTETNKWIGAKAYGRIFGFESEEIIAIGDDFNDYEMILKAGVGIAMKDSSDEVLHVADYITEYGPSKYGAFRAIEKYLKV